MDAWVGKIPWRRTWQPTPVFLPGESYGQRSLAGYSPWGGKESDTTEATEHAHTEKERLRKQSRRLSLRKKEYIVRKDGQQHQMF